MNFDDLTDAQREAVESDAERLVVFGGAGAGKTTVALLSAYRQLERDSDETTRALFLTFSKAAVRELAGRASAALGDLNARIEVHTFHSFAHRLIRSFGRYVGLGVEPPALQSECQQRLFGKDTSQLRYNDLLPHALAILRSPLLREMFAKRWSVVVCDEFQDTDDSQWDLLTELAKHARLALFADLNQMIYTFLPGVGPQRVARARDEADQIIDLGSPSHRDPSGVIPAMAEAVRQRAFGSEPVHAALEQERLVVHPKVPNKGLAKRLRDHVIDARRSGARSVAIFAHSNHTCAALSADLLREKVEHTLVGLPEAHGEALAAMEELVRFGLGESTRNDTARKLAVYTTSTSRTKKIPDLAQGILGRIPLVSGVKDRLEELHGRLLETGESDLGELVREAASAWETLRIVSGRRPWGQAGKTFTARATQALSIARDDEEEFLGQLANRVAELRGETLVGTELINPHPVQLMNFHQTKGREADVVILVYRDDDFFGKGGEPFPKNSKLLYVSLTRARKQNMIILPHGPHPLVAPFENLR